MERFQLNVEYTRIAVSRYPSITAVFTDGEYIVERHTTLEDEPYAYRLAIKRKDKAPIRSWRELQDIKNDVAGEDAIAIEVYPRESEVTDTANMYHLWVMR